MDDTKSISPAVKGLVETIQNQAKEYEKAFKFLEVEKMKLEQQRHDQARLLDDLRNEVNYTTLKLNQKVQESLKYIESRTEKTITIYDNLENIIDLRDSLSQLRQMIKKQIADIENFLKTEIPKTVKEFDLLLKSVKNKSDNEIEALIKSTKAKVDKELEDETRKIEQRASLKLKQLEGKLISIDQAILRLTENQPDNFEAINGELTKLNSRLNEYKAANERMIGELDERISKTGEILAEKIDLVDTLMNDLEKTKSKSRDLQFQIENNKHEDTLDYGRALADLKNSVDNMKKEIRHYERREKLALAIAAIFFVCLLYLLIVHFT